MSDLRNLQAEVLSALLVPLNREGRLDRARAGVKRAASLIRQNSRLTAADRLEIYSRSYWARVLESLTDDFPGLELILGPATFNRLAVQYLCDCPSESFSLRDLGSRLETWLRAHPPKSAATLALDMTRLEWAHIAAFDCATDPVLRPDDLTALGPSTKLRLQPGITLLDVSYPVDELKIQINQADVDATLLARCRKRAGILKRTAPKPLYIAVHNAELSVWYRRLTREEFLLLRALQSRKSIRAAIHLAFTDSAVAEADRPGLLHTWFATWAQLGWLCPVARRRSRRR